jgi:membrane fusion protein, heavy metal efflux system
LADEERNAVSARAGLAGWRVWTDKARGSCIVGGFVVLGMAATAIYFGPRLVPRLGLKKAAMESSEAATARSAVLVKKQPDTLQLSEEAAAALSVTTTPVQRATAPIELRFSGSLSLDPSRYAIVRSRFAGEVVERPPRPSTGTPVAIGDTVEQGELLAVVWSRELGEKKSELVDALLQLSLDQGTYDRSLELYQKGDLPERTLRETLRAVQTDKIAVDRVIRTLQSWRETEESIAAVRAEADHHPAGALPSEDARAPGWARVEIRAPLTGAVLESNATVGELVQTTDEIFKIADLSRLRVMAHAYEEDLPHLDALPTDQRQWQGAVPAESDVERQAGSFDRIGQIIDPAQHTALVLGWVQNPNGRLRVGQFITATVRLACADDEVVIPASAVLEAGAAKFVFVQPTEGRQEYQLRRIQLARRLEVTVTVRGQPSAAAEASPLRVGDRVVTSGAVEMLGSLREQQAAN